MSNGSGAFVVPTFAERFSRSSVLVISWKCFVVIQYRSFLCTGEGVKLGGTSILDGSREIAAIIMATSTTTLTHPILFFWLTLFARPSLNMCLASKCWQYPSSCLNHVPLWPEEPVEENVVWEPKSDIFGLCELYPVHDHHLLHFLPGQRSASTPGISDYLGSLCWDGCFGLVLFVVYSLWPGYSHVLSQEFVLLLFWRSLGIGIF